MSDTRWADIAGFEGRYQVSDTGEVRSLVTNRIMRLMRHNMGYLSVALTLRDGSGKKKSFLVHRLVATAFIENKDGLPTVNHRNGDRTDNRHTNLEWMTYSANHQHAYNQLGRKPYLASLRDSSRRCACFANGQQVGEFKSATAAAKVLGVSGRQISKAALKPGKVYAGRTWVYLT